MYFVYLLESIESDHLCIGYTENPKRRLAEHNRKENLSTKAFAPWSLIFIEGYLDENDAKRRENYLKTSRGSRLLKRMLKEYFWQKHKQLKEAR